MSTMDADTSIDNGRPYLWTDRRGNWREWKETSKDGGLEYHHRKCKRRRQSGRIWTIIAKECIKEMDHSDAGENELMKNVDIGEGRKHHKKLNNKLWRITDKAREASIEKKCERLEELGLWKRYTIQLRN